MKNKIALLLLTTLLAGCASARLDRNYERLVTAIPSQAGGFILFLKEKGHCQKGQYVIATDAHRNVTSRGCWVDEWVKIKIRVDWTDGVVDYYDFSAPRNWKRFPTPDVYMDGLV